jgi:hypothetical protein
MSLVCRIFWCSLVFQKSMGVIRSDLVLVQAAKSSVNAANFRPV